MFKKLDLLSLFENSEGVKSISKGIKAADSRCIHLKEMVTSSLSTYSAAAIQKVGGVHVFIAEHKDAAGYLLSDFYSLLGEENDSVLFFPSSYKRSLIFGSEDASSLVARTSTLAALRTSERPYYIVVTYPEAICELVVDPTALQRDKIELSKGDKIDLRTFAELVEQSGFERVDFVYEPGHYSIRGGILDIFSYSNSAPYRIDMFGDEVDSIRTFNISSQLSIEKTDHVQIIPNLNVEGGSDAKKIPFSEFVGKANYWFTEPDLAFKHCIEARRKLLLNMDEPTQIDSRVSTSSDLLHGMASSTIFTLRDTMPERPADTVIEFSTTPQPNFNKSFEVLASDLTTAKEEGYTTYILSRNEAQIERLENIFHQIGYKNISFLALRYTLNEGFIDKALNIRLYSEHQIFERYQRYKIRGTISRDEQLTIAELNALKLGDFVVHFDFGVGRFGGLVKVREGEKTKEAIKLIYKDNDVVFVNVHSLHRISRYRSGDGELAKMHKLGSGVWQKLKSRAKSAVKDISRELIALYAKRKASAGFAFSPDGYLQEELEASFPYEDTPDQSLATQAVKKDMESSEPMDRLICGDVGFGKTEIAVRAAFKAATDGKQTALLVPTTILAMQHYRTFMKRLRDLPVRVEYLNRTKSTKEANEILAELADGKVDILIGTHKILSKNVTFKDLGLLIIDEEQKFGVAAKEKLTHLSVNVDTLTLTATPIPRTLQFSIMGSRDLSVISTPPPNRQPIITESHIFSEAIIAEAVESELARGGQLYFVHNRVEDMRSIKAMIERAVPQARVAMGHGQMPAKELEALIMNFIYGEFDVLLATTIIENGIDVPNANTIIINNAHYFGVSALHQLRGRVGRSDRKAYCYLLTPPDALISSDAIRRLRAIEEFSDLGSGFNIAMQDLDIRGAGNLLGAEQSGFIADIGAEAYQKIMQEAIEELRAEGLDVGGISPKGEGDNGEPTQVRYVTDAQIDIDVEANLPESYVQQSGERLRLYRELDSIEDDDSLDTFANRLRDRFGELPHSTQELLNVVRLRREAIRLGVERVKVKNGLMLLDFVSEPNSPYYQSETFHSLLQHITQNSDRYLLRQNNNKLGVTVRRISNIAEGYALLKSL